MSTELRRACSWQKPPLASHHPYFDYAEVPHTECHGAGWSNPNLSVFMRVTSQCQVPVTDGVRHLRDPNYAGDLLKSGSVLSDVLVNPTTHKVSLSRELHYTPNGMQQYTYDH